MKFFKTFFLTFLSGLLLTILSSNLLFSDTWSLTSDTNFNAGTLKKVIVEGSGDTASVKLATPSEGSWYDSSWLYRKKLGVAHSTATLVDVQVFLPVGAGEGYLNIADLVNAGKVKSDYGDIRFADSNGTTLLPYWVYYTTYAPVGTLQGFWVRIPSIPENADKGIFMYYGNSSTGTTSSFTNTMTKISSLTAFGNPDARLKGLWHFDEGTGVAGAITSDASGTGNNGTLSGAFSWLSSGDGGKFSTLSTETVKFQTGSALDFTAAGSVNCGTNSSLAFTNAYTLMTWVYFNTTNLSGYPELIGRSNYVLYLTPAATGIAITGKYKYELNAGDTNLITVYLPTVVANTNEWYHLVLTFDKDGAGNNIKIYLNGQEAASTAAVKASSGTASATFRIGTFAMMDEVAAYNVALSFEEIMAHYERRKYMPVTPYLSDVGPEVGPWVTSSAYELIGTFTSQTLDTGYVPGAEWETITWSPASQTAAGTSLKFQLASNNNNRTWIYHGPDGSTTTYYSNPTTDATIWFNHDGHRYLRCKAYLLSDTYGTVTPTFEDVSITYVLPPSTQTATTIAAGQAGTVDAYWLKLSIPAETVTQNVKYTLTNKTSPSTCLQGEPIQAIKSYEIKAEDADTGEIVKKIGGLITITMMCRASWSAVDGKYYVDNTYPAVSLDDAPTKLAIAHFDGVKWQIVGGTVTVTDDKATIVAKISHLSEYGIVVKPAAGLLPALSVGPNPFTPMSTDDRFNKVYFTFTNDNAEEVVLKIYNMLGKIIKTVTFAGIANTFWDGTDDNDEVVDGGVYLYQIKVGSTVIGKGPVVLA
ncbi:MAG TPA: hypothetical protein DCP53_03780, partial [Elusimicrobia bacterium]|nr:hypothetical protein [Elusimicrobiota bacterium]